MQQLALLHRWAAPSAQATQRDIGAEHAAIVDATVARDAPEAVRRLAAHYEESLQIMLGSGLVVIPGATSMS